MTVLLYAAYSRVSLDEQRKGISPEDQILRIHEWARHQSIPFQLARYEGKDEKEYDAEFYEDHTGFDYERPEMDVVRELARLGIINAVIVLRTDRFARDEAVFMLLERFYKKHGVRLFSVEEGEFTPGVVNRYVAAFQRARAEDEAQTVKKRMRDARLAYLKSGTPQSQGQALFGYHKQGKKRETIYIINEEQAIVVRLIYHLYIHEMLSVGDIARQLNENDIPAPAAAKGWKTSSGKWIDTTVRRILRNSGYKGLLVGYQTRMIEGKNIPTDSSEHITITIPAIIDEDIWDQAQYLLEHRRLFWARREKRRDYLLSGMITCTCGHAMVGEADKTRGKYYYYYRCNSHNSFLTSSNCVGKRVQAERIEETVWDFLERLVTDTQTAMALYQDEHTKTESVLFEVRQRIQVIHELLEENSDQQKRLNWMFQRKRCDEDYFEAEWIRLDQERIALMREREKVERILKSQEATSHQFEELERIGQDLKDATEEATFEKKRKMLERLRTCITVEGLDRDGVYWMIVEVLGYRQRVSLNPQSPCKPPRLM